VEPKS